mgnify:CR=1 FL=1
MEPKVCTLVLDIFLYKVPIPFLIRSEDLLDSGRVIELFDDSSKSFEKRDADLDLALNSLFP